MGSADDVGRPPGAGGMAARLRAARGRAFVGRQAERALFASALEEDLPPFVVLHLHGPAGVGKSALLGQYAELARAAGRTVAVVDGRSIDASPTGFTSALRGQLGDDGADPVATLATDPAPVLLVDTWERLTALDDWMRTTLVPALPSRAVVVLAGRERPRPGWRGDPAWDDLLRVVALRDLHAEEARALLLSRGVDPARHDEVLAEAHGHPLALVLVADLLRGHDGDAPFRLDEAPDVIEALLHRYLGHVTDGDRRRTLHVTAHAGFATEALLRDIVDDTRADELFDWLRSRPFTEWGGSGIALHELVGDALDAELRLRDPDGYATLHHDVVRHLAERTLAASGAARDRAMLDLLHLYRHNAITRPFLGGGSSGTWMEPATAHDREAIVAMARHHEGPTSAALAASWFDRQPDAFSVFRTATSDGPTGFVAHLLLGDGPDPEDLEDPVVAAVWDHVRAHAPTRTGEHVRLMRFWIDADDHQDAATFPLVSARATVDYTLGTDLAWAFGAIADADAYASMFAFVDFHPVPTTVAVGPDHTVGLFARDMRQDGSTWSWWLDLADRMIATTGDVDRLPPLRRRLLVLDHEAFVEAVRDALRGLRRPGALDDNPLLRSRVVVERTADHDPATVLVGLLHEAADELTGHPRDAKAHRALDRTYFRPAPTQEAAAEVLDLPFSTYRRHLATGVDHVTAWLWDRELHGHGPGTDRAGDDLADDHVPPRRS